MNKYIAIVTILLFTVPLTVTGQKTLDKGLLSTVDTLEQKTEETNKSVRESRSDLEDIKLEITNLKSKIDRLSKRNSSELAFAICGALNSTASQLRGHWDYGRPHLLTEVESCSTFCGKVENTKQCDATVMFNQSLAHVTGDRCDLPLKTYQHYFEANSVIYCCCR